MNKKALILYFWSRWILFSRIFIKKNYKVLELRRSSSINTKRLDDIYEDPLKKIKKLNLLYGDMTAQFQLQKLSMILNQMKFTT